MVQLNGIYENGHITLQENISASKPLKVIVTFVDDDVLVTDKRLSINDFSFLQSRELLKNVQGNLSDAVIEERRSEYL